MPKNDYYKVYSTKLLPEIGNVYCIITGVEADTYGKILSEYYLLIPHMKQSFGLISESQIEEVLGIKIDLDYLFHNSFKIAIGKIDNYLYEQLKDKNHQLYVETKIELSEINILEIIDLVKGDDFRDFFNSIRVDSSSEKLRRDISFIWNSEKTIIKKREIK